MLRFIVALSLALCGATLHAQPPDLSGKWRGTLETKSGTAPMELYVVIKGRTGTLRMSLSARALGSGRLGACYDRDLPLEVVEPTDTDVVLDVQGAKVLQGCLNQKARLKLVDGKTLEGTLADGRAMKLTR